VARITFIFNAHNDVLQEVAKFRAARRLWDVIMRDRYGATTEKAQALRFHAQTGGSTLTAQQPENNLVRVSAQALAAVYGGAQSLHTNAFDEALALPTEHAATLALRTQQVLMHEAGTTATADPLGGSWYVESLTDELEARARELIEQVDELGGAVAAIEAGWVQEQIEESAFRWQREVETGERVIIGVNRFTTDAPDRVELHRLDPAIERAQRDRLQELRAARDSAAVEAAIAEVRRLEPTGTNLLPALRTALAARATVGELCGALREVWGTYDAVR
jgi:methylmalonyl-CoA mutase N-terminal domain/subunit